MVATQFEMKTAEQIGLLKMDFLGLRTLTVVHDAVRFIKENRGVHIDIDALEPDDRLTYELLRSGRTTGVFQLESSGMRDLSRRIGLESLEEICALVALYRPGPMQLKDQYIENKHNPAKLTYDHPLLEPILKETYGVALYQEQVMQIVQALAGFSLGQADELRRAMAKKKADLMERQGEQFLKGAKENGIDEETATSLFQKIEQFAGYGFNKSHSMAYAFVAYQTAFLKANYPVEFMAALLTSESGNLDKVAQYIEECRRMGIEILPPTSTTAVTDSMSRAAPSVSAWAPSRTSAGIRSRPFRPSGKQTGRTRTSSISARGWTRGCSIAACSKASTGRAPSKARDGTAGRLRNPWNRP